MGGWATGHSPLDGLAGGVPSEVPDVLTDGGVQAVPRLPVLLQPLHHHLVVVPQVGLGKGSRPQRGSPLWDRPALIPHGMYPAPAPPPPQAHLDGPLGLHKPAAQHGLDVRVAQLAAGPQDLLPDLLLQQEAAQTPVQSGAGGLPLQDILRASPRSEPQEGAGDAGHCLGPGPTLGAGSVITLQPRKLRRLPGSGRAGTLSGL